MEARVAPPSRRTISTGPVQLHIRVHSASIGTHILHLGGGSGAQLGLLSLVASAPLTQLNHQKMSGKAVWPSPKDAVLANTTRKFIMLLLFLRSTNR